MDADKFHLRARHLIVEYFRSSPQFYFDVTQEALTGNIKFTDRDSIATHLMGITKDGKNLEYYNLSDTSTINMVVSKSKPDVSFSSYKKGRKNTTKVLHYFSVFRMLYAGINEEIDKYANQPYLMENMITDIWMKIKQWVKSVIDYVQQMIQQGIHAVMEFLGFGLTLTAKEIELA